MSDLETQARIMHTSDQIREQLKGIQGWEKEMKQKDAQRKLAELKEAIDQDTVGGNSVKAERKQFISSSSNSTSSVGSTMQKKPADIRTIPNAVEKANEFKKRGNNCVKNYEYKKAVQYYTEAIRLNKSEAVYYTNRALCYLKLNQYTECIDDCTMAIQLDANAVKAYYRRMQAHEQMDGDLLEALNDCKTVLRIEPKNSDAQKSLVRLEASLNPTANKVMKLTLDAEPLLTQIPWSQFDGDKSCKQVDFVTKAPHSRSKQPLKRIAIGQNDLKIEPVSVAMDSIQTSSTTIKPVIDSEAITPKSHIDQPAKPKETNNNTSESKIPAINECKPKLIQTKLVIPKNSAQFYRIWKSIKNHEQQFVVLKAIYNDDIGKMLGAQFSLEMLREIFIILKSHFIHQNLPIANILSGIVKNDQMMIITAMMNADDQLAFTKLIEYMRIRGEDAQQIDTIQKTFDNLISM